MVFTRVVGWAMLCGGCMPVTAPVGPDTDTVTVDTDAPVETAPTGPPNILIVILDDIGTDLISGYAVHPDPIATPRLDELAARGVLFDQAIGEPVCSPARAALLTGLHPFRLGVGNPIAAHEAFEMDPAAWTLPRALRDGTTLSWPSALVGKWHLSADDAVYADHPLRSGFDHHWGTLGNLNAEVVSDGTGAETYDHYDKAEDGVVRVSERYATLETNEDALAFVASADEPWLTVVSYNAAHFPWHVPPRSLLGAVSDPIPRRPNDRQMARLMVASADAAVGRLLDGLDPEVARRTWIFVLSDNGSSEEAAANELQGLRSKGTMYRGGIRVPLIVAGPGLASPGRRTDALVQLTDVFATVLDLVGADVAPPVDAISFAPVLTEVDGTSARTFAYAEQFEPNGPGPYRWQRQAVRDARYKVVIEDGTPVQLFDQQVDPYELDNLMHAELSAEAEAALARLLEALPR